MKSTRGSPVTLACNSSGNTHWYFIGWRTEYTQEMIVDKVNKIRVYSRLVDDGYYLCVGWYPDFTTFIATALLKVYGNINITCMGQCQYHKNYQDRKIYMLCRSKYFS